MKRKPLSFAKTPADWLRCCNIVTAMILARDSGWKDGDRGGPARTEGIHRKEKRKKTKKRKTHLTHTGLLMEGL
jgi:hypothetical protein